ncbi:hypothetical protein H4582DRAFT_2063438 [Lactarius indigo]|nr:hypothetical protein H4582DRAFT_2063438 [Lactarius indigo]
MSRATLFTRRKKHNQVSHLTPSSSSSPTLAAAPIRAQNGGAQGKKGGARGREANEGTPPSTLPPSPLAAPPCGAEGTCKGTAHPLPLLHLRRREVHKGMPPLYVQMGKGCAQGHATPSTTLYMWRGHTGAPHPLSHLCEREAHKSTTPQPPPFPIRTEGGAHTPLYMRREHAMLPLCFTPGPSSLFAQEGGMWGHEGSPCACIHHACPLFLPATVLLRYKD